MTMNTRQVTDELEPDFLDLAAVALDNAGIDADTCLQAACELAL